MHFPFLCLHCRCLKHTYFVLLKLLLLTSTYFHRVGRWLINCLMICRRCGFTIFWWEGNKSARLLLNLSRYRKTKEVYRARVGGFNPGFHPASSCRIGCISRVCRLDRSLSMLTGLNSFQVRVRKKHWAVNLILQMRMLRPAAAGLGFSVGRLMNCIQNMI